MQLPVFQSPHYLWLLLLAPLFLIRRRREGGVRGLVILIARLAVFLLVVATLGEPAIRKKNDAVTAYFVLDRSGSIPEAMQAWSLDVVRRAAHEKPRKEDRTGLIVFGDDAIVEEGPTAHFRVDRIFSTVDGSNTDLSAAILLALSTFPDDTQKRIVLFTDGNETKGDLQAALQRAIAARCPIDVVPIKYKYTDEVLLESLSLPRKVQRDEPFQIRANVGSLSDNSGTLRLFCDGQLIAARDVTLRASDNIFLFSHTLKDPGFHLFEAEIDSPRDGIRENNRAQAYTIIEQESLVLLAGSAESDVSHLAAALREAGISTRVRTAGSLPRDLGEWQGYDAIVFANLAAEHVSLAQMEMIESLVRDLGTGFMMVGGEKSFGAGGWLASPVERLLPVRFDVNQNQVLPNGGIAFILDHVYCIGDRWSKDICVETLKRVDTRDEFGLLVGGRDDWVIPLAPAEDKAAITRRIDEATVGDVDDVDRYLQRVLDAFAHAPCSYKHAVLVTDGSPGTTPGNGMIARLREAKITLSIAVIEPRNGGSVQELRAAAQAAGGNFYVVQPHERHLVPQIIIKESTLLKKGLYFEQKFTPVMRENSEILEGIGSNEFPALYGYNVTSRKDPTEIPLVSPGGDAVLAHWHYGLGKSVAFTSDAAARWGRDWVSWAKYRQFWSQAVRWCQRRIPPSPYQLTIQKGKKDGMCEAIIDAQDEHGNFVNFLSPRGTLVSPDLQSRPLPFEQTGPGRYRAVFPTEKAGGYVVHVQYTQDGKPYMLRGGYVPPYNLEYHRFETNEALLLSIADQTGGRVMAPGMDFYQRTGAIAYTSHPIWPILLILAVCLFPFDVVARRVVISGRDLVALVRKILPGFRKKPDPALAALAAEREAIRLRSAWEPSRPTVEGVSAETAVAIPAAAEDGPVEEIEHSRRLLEAKKRARKELDQR